MNHIAAALAELASALYDAVAGEPANSPEEQPFYLEAEDRARLARTTLRMRAEQCGGISVNDLTRAARLWVIEPSEVPAMAEHLATFIKR